MRNAIRLAIVAFVATLAIAPAVAQQPAPTPPPGQPAAAAGEPAAPTGPEVTDIEFEGVTAFDTDVLEQTIVTSETECRSAVLSLFCALGIGWAQERAYLDPVQLERDEERITELYSASGYPDARVEAIVRPEGGAEVEVVFRVFEGEPIRVASLEIRGLGTLEPPVELPERLPLEVGDPYSLPRLDTLQLEIQRAFAERAHPYAQVEIGGEVDDAARAANVVLTVEPGPAAVFGETRIVTEEPIDEEVVRERLAYRPGDPFSLSAIEDTQRRLYALPIVERVTVQPTGLETGDTVVVPTFQVEARRASGIEAEGAISSAQCIELDLTWRSNYFLGGPGVFALTVGGSNLLADQLSGFPCTGVEDEAGNAFTDPGYRVVADLRQPWPGSPETALLLGGYLIREVAPSAYVRRGYGGQIGIAREFEPDFAGIFQYAPARNELAGADIFFCGTYGVCDEPRLAELTGLTWLTPVQSFLTWLPTGPPVLLRPPLPGERWRNWVRGAADGAAGFTGSDWDFLRLIPEAGLTRILGPSSELAGRGRFGLLVGDRSALPPQVRLYSGGVNTVRGVPQNLLGPAVLSASSANAIEIGCTIAPAGCPAGITVDPDLVALRPTGGEFVGESNLEARYWVTPGIQMAAFADFGVVGRTLQGDNISPATEDWVALVTPGIGLRLLTPIGPLRLDVAYDPSSDRDLALLTRDPDTGDILVLGTVRYAPYTWDDPSGFTEFWRRLQLQVAIGAPF